MARKYVSFPCGQWTFFFPVVVCLGFFPPSYKTGSWEKLVFNSSREQIPEEEKTKLRTPKHENKKKQIKRSSLLVHQILLSEEANPYRHFVTVQEEKQYLLFPAHVTFILVTFLVYCISEALPLVSDILYFDLVFFFPLFLTLFLPCDVSGNTLLIHFDLLFSWWPQLHWWAGYRGCTIHYLWKTLISFLNHLTPLWNNFGLSLFIPYLF